MPAVAPCTNLQTGSRHTRAINFLNCLSDVECVMSSLVIKVGSLLVKTLSKPIAVGIRSILGLTTLIEGLESD